MSGVSLETVLRMWMVTLVVYGVVLVVVALLLTLILRVARQIKAGVAAIWTVGQQVANNTIHIALLDTTNQLAAEILASARPVAAATAAMQMHATHCRGCPACVLGEGALR